MLTLRLWSRAALGTLLGCSVSIALAADNPVAAVHELTLQWTGLEQQKETLQANWRRDQPVLEQQLALLEREAEELEQLLASSAQQQSDVEQRRLDLLGEQSRLEQEQTALERGLEQATIALYELHPQLPPPLREAWSQDLSRLGDALLSTSEKLQVVLALLRQLDDFQQKVTVNTAVTALPTGGNHLVSQVFLGLSHGWYVSADGRIAAAGMPSPGGWQWRVLPDAAEVARIVAILERRSSPALVTVPLRLQNVAGAGAD